MHTSRQQIHEIRDRLQGPFSGLTKHQTACNAFVPGEILISPVGQSKSRSPFPSGLIHDWIGAAFIPDVTAEDVCVPRFVTTAITRCFTSPRWLIPGRLAADGALREVLDDAW